MMKKVILLVSLVSLSLAGFPEYYYKLNTKEMKKEFVKILTPLIDNVNEQIVKDKNRMEISFDLLSKNANDTKAIESLKKIAKKYNMKDYDDKFTMSARVNTVPKNLALAQAVLESGWGKSYFVRKANNIFGHWTFSKTGLIPKNRDAGKKHRIRVFKTLQDSVEAYMKNLNTHGAYRLFRKVRKEYKDNNKTFNAIVAADTMINYSELKEEYIKRLKRVIKQVSK